MPALLECPLNRTGTGSHELTSPSDTSEASNGASFLEGDTTLPHRVLICWREGCGRHSARQSGGPSNIELYCCVPCAQLEGHSDRCDRAYLQHALLGGRPDPLAGDDARLCGPDLAEACSWGTRWRSRTTGTSATGTPVDNIMVGAPLSTGRISLDSEPPPARGAMAGVLGPAKPTAAMVPPAAADAMANAVTRPQSGPHGSGVSVDGTSVAAPGGGMAGADGTGDGLMDGLALGGQPLGGLYTGGSAPGAPLVEGRHLVGPGPTSSVDVRAHARVPHIFRRRVVTPLRAGLQGVTPTLPTPLAPVSEQVHPPAPAPTQGPLFRPLPPRPLSLRLPSPHPSQTRPAWRECTSRTAGLPFYFNATTGESTYNNPTAFRGATPGTLTPASLANGEHAIIRDSFPKRDWHGFEVCIASVPSNPLIGEYEATLFSSHRDHRDVRYLVEHAFRGLSLKIAGNHLARPVSGFDAASSPAPAPAPAPAPMPSTEPTARPLVLPTGAARASRPAPAPAPTPSPARPAPSWTRAPPAQRMPTQAPARPAAARVLRKRARKLQQGYDGLRHEDDTECTEEELVAHVIALSEADVAPAPAPATSPAPTPAPAPALAPALTPTPHEPILCGCLVCAVDGHPTTRHP